MNDVLVDEDMVIQCRGCKVEFELPDIEANCYFCGPCQARIRFENPQTIEQYRRLQSTLGLYISPEGKAYFHPRFFM